MGTASFTISIIEANVDIVTHYLLKFLKAQPNNKINDKFNKFVECKPIFNGIYVQVGTQKLWVPVIITAYMYTIRIIMFEFTIRIQSERVRFTYAVHTRIYFAAVLHTIGMNFIFVDFIDV